MEAPVLVIYGDKDPDFPDPAKEAREVAELLRGKPVIIKDAGHYPHVEKPEPVAAAILPFLESKLGAR